MNLNQIVKLIFVFVISIFIVVACNLCSSVDKVVSNPPKPEIVSHDFDDSSTRLGEYSGIVWAEIRNDGGDGDVVLEITVNQNGKKYKKTKKRFFTAKETAKMEIVFDEITLKGERPESEIRVYAY